MKYYEVNTVLNKDGEIATSNTFMDFDEARRFYESIGDGEMKEIMLYDEEGYGEEIISNYGH